MKKSDLKSILTISAFCMGILAFAGARPAVAEMQEHAKAECHRPCKTGYAWRETLTDEQKAKVDLMHLQLKKEKGLIEAKIGVKRAELNELLLQDAPAQKDVDQKINELSELKKKIFQMKIGHVIKMRQILTPEQRVSFDSSIMNMADGHGDHDGQWTHGE